MSPKEETPMSKFFNPVRGGLRIPCSFKLVVPNYLLITIIWETF